MGKLARWVVAVALAAGCAKSVGIVPPPADGGNPSVIPGDDAGQPDSGLPDAGKPDAGHPDAGTDAGTPADAGSDAGTPPDAGTADAGTADAGTADAGTADAGTADAGTADAGTDGGTTFGGPGPWPATNQIYGGAQGIQELPVVGVSTDETQNLWVATHSALYVMRPGQTKFTRFDENTGSPDTPNRDNLTDGVGNRLHLSSNPVRYCDNNFGNPDSLSPPPDHACPIYGAAGTQGISEIVGGGPNEVFVGYYGNHTWDLNDGTWADADRHSGKADRVRLNADGSIQVVRFDMVSTDNVMFWHNKTVERMIYDHFKHRHELYVGTDHGVDKFTPDAWHPANGWFASAANNDQWMSDHLHAQACYHAACVGDSNQRLGDWRGLAIDPAGDLWTAGRWAAGKIRYAADNGIWWQTPRPDKLPAFAPNFGDPYDGNCNGNRPVFCAPQEGDFVNLSAVAVTPDPDTGQDKVWFASGILYGEVGEVNYGVAAFLAHPGPREQPWTYYDPMRDIGMAESNVRDMLALPDGRLVLAGPTTGLVIWNPVTGAHTAIRAGQGIPSDQVYRLELDTMVNPPALHVSTAGGAAVLRQLP